MPAVRASKGIAFTMFSGNPRSSKTAAMGIETFITRGLPQTLATASRIWRARETYGPLMPRLSASSRIRSARGSSGRCTGWPKPGILPPDFLMSLTICSATTPASLPERTVAWASCNNLAQVSEVPRMTGPQPRIPAATALSNDPGLAASVMRATTLVGIMPCSAMAISRRSRK